ncbi:MAG TPA: adenylate/guanylate cyclase domain-containing protein [Candidatus Binatia bacterium]|nr:adenylate/guanylate cyclase domain-containing protein [Candidatus Binatia bacterium]
MLCPQCQCENLPDSIFCDQCGTRVETVCSHCGEPNRREARFCRICGQIINQTATIAPARVPGVPSPDSYVPRHLAEKILESRQSLEGERKEVTVLFADIRGSTRLLEGLDPEDAQKLIDPVLRVMMDAVHRYEGTVNQVLGDGIMALFGAPLAHEDHAVRACYAALAMQEEMRRYRANRGQSDELGLQISIGLNSGEVVVRSISNDLNVDYSALGHTTHLAARMQELAGAGAILMTAATLREVEGFVEVKSLGTVQAKGVSRPLDAYELVGATSARTRLHAAAPRGLTPFVGRKTEIETFQKVIEKSAAGHGQIFSMVGEPGMGKSRLVYESIHSHVPPDWLVLEAPSVSYGKATPYFPVIELLRRYCEISGGEEVGSIREKIADHVLRLDEMLKDAIPPILALLGALPDHEEDGLASHESNDRRQDVGDAIKKFNEMEPQQRRRQTFESLKRLMIRESQKQPLLMVFEDLHWIDNETQAFLDKLVESLPMARILLLVNYRPGYSHNWADKAYYTQLRIDPLQSASAEQLLQHLLGSNKELAPLKESLTQRTEGNPFFAEQSVRSLVETGTLIGEKGNYRPGLALDSIRIPRSVQSVVADRIDRLSTAQKHLLQTAAVIGVVVPFKLLRSVAELPDDELYAYLAKLQSAEFICETSLFPEVEYSFKHALTTEVAYGALLHERRTFLHARIVRALEEMTENISHDHLEKLAHHAFYGEIWDKAVSYSKDAGSKAMGRSAYRGAVIYFDRALASLEHLPKSRPFTEQAIDLRLDLRNALFPLEELDRLVENLRAAESLSETLGDQRRLGRISSYMVHYYTLMGDREKATEASRRGLSLAQALDDFALQIQLNYYLGRAYYYTGEYEQAIDCHKRNIESLHSAGVREYFDMECPPSILCRVFLVMCFAETGEFGAAIEYGTDAIRIAHEIDHSFGSVYADFGMGLAYLRKGDVGAAVVVLERGLERCRIADIPVQFPLVASPLGLAYVLSGRVAEGTALLEQAVGQTASKRSSGQGFRLSWLSEAYLRAGRIEEAASHAELALEFSRNHQERGREAWILRQLGKIHARRNPSDVDRIEFYYRQALKQATELKMRPLIAHCHLSLGALYVQIDRSDKAQKELSTAIDLYRLMEMTAGLREAEIALAKIAQTVPSTSQTVGTH